MQKKYVTKSLLILLLAVLLAFSTSFTACAGNERPLDEIDSAQIVYKEVGGISLGLEILYPTNAVKQKSPAVLLFHGGGWVSGAPEEFTTDFAPLCDTLRANGITLVSVTYRLAVNGCLLRDCIDDCEDALEFIIDHAEEYGIDSEKVGVMGYSAGGHLALMTAIEMESAVKYCVSLSGPTYFTRDESSSYYSEPLSYFTDCIFKGDNAFDLYRQSPIIRINRRCSAGFLIVHGMKDVVVPPMHSEAFANEAKLCGVDCKFIEPVGLSHSYPASPGFSELCGEIAGAITSALS